MRNTEVSFLLSASHLFFQRDEDTLGAVSKFVEFFCPTPKFVMDIGAGSGEFSSRLARSADAVYALEPDPVQFGALLVNSFIVRNAGAAIVPVPLPFLDFTTKHEFDLIFMKDVLALVSEDEIYPTFRRISRLLSQDGIAIISGRQSSPHRQNTFKNDPHTETNGVVSFRLEACGEIESDSAVVRTDVQFVVDGETLLTQSCKQQLRIFSLDTLANIWAEVGLQVKALCADWGGQPYDPKGPTFVIVLGLA